MPTGESINPCLDNFQRHEFQLTQNGSDIKELQISMRGMPEQITYLSKQVEEMCRLMREQESRYMRKDEFIIEKKAVWDDLTASKIIVAAITKKMDGVMSWVLATLSASLLGLIIFLIQSHMKV